MQLSSHIFTASNVAEHLFQKISVLTKIGPNQQTNWPSEIVNYDFLSICPEAVLRLGFLWLWWCRDHVLRVLFGQTHDRDMNTIPSLPLTCSCGEYIDTNITSFAKGGFHALDIAEWSLVSHKNEYISLMSTYRGTESWNILQVGLSPTLILKIKYSFVRNIYPLRPLSVPIQIHVLSRVKHEAGHRIGVCKDDSAWKRKHNPPCHMTPSHDTLMSRRVNLTCRRVNCLILGSDTLGVQTKHCPEYEALASRERKGESARTYFIFRVLHVDLSFGHSACYYLND